MIEVTRKQILARRQRVGALGERLPAGSRSLRHAAWAGLQDSMPRAALLSIHARVEGASATTWEDPSLVQVWGPRFSVFVVAERDRALFTLGRMPHRGARRELAVNLANRLHDLLGEGEMTYGEAGRALGEHPNALRYATLTGRVSIRWDGARQPTIRIVPAPDIQLSQARLGLARRYLHVFGPSTSESFATWAGVKPDVARETFQLLRGSLRPVRTPIREAWALEDDEAGFRADEEPAAPARLLPSGDAYYLLWGEDRRLLIPDKGQRAALWTSRVWPGALLVGGEIVGTWRRARGKVTVHPWRSLQSREREAVEAEAVTLPLPDVAGGVSIHWAG